MERLNPEPFIQPELQHCLPGTSRSLKVCVSASRCVALLPALPLAVCISTTLPPSGLEAVGESERQLQAVRQAVRGSETETVAH